MTADAPRATRAVITAPGRIELQAGPAPGPSPLDLVIRPDAVGICGTDVELLDGTMPYLNSGFSLYPLVPGHEWTGRVIEVGDAVDNFSVGDRVVGECSVGCCSCEQCLAGSHHLCPQRTETGIAGRDGALASLLLFPSSAAHRVPDNVTAADAALIEPLAVAYRGVRSISERPEPSLAVVGAGTIGLLCALVARALGNPNVTIFETQPGRRDFAATLGFTVNGAGDGRRSFPRVIEASGTASGVRSALAICAAGGGVVLLGLTGSPCIEIDIDGIVIGDLTVRGSLGSAGVWPQVIDLVASEQLRPSTLVSDEFALEQVVEAFATAAHPNAGTRKVLVRPSGRG
jgi:L-iditol 2-dehydrogenase